MTDKDLMPFGKYKGDKIGEVSASYLLWAYSQPDLMKRYPELKEYIEKGRKALEEEAKTERW